MPLFQEMDFKSPSQGPSFSGKRNQALDIMLSMLNHFLRSIPPHHLLTLLGRILGNEFTVLYKYQVSFPSFLSTNSTL